MKKTLLSAVAALFAMTVAASVHVTAEVYDDDTGRLYAGTNARVRVVYSNGANEFETESSSTVTVEVNESTMSGAYGSVYALINGCVADPDLNRAATRWEIVDDSTGIGLAVTSSGANAAAIALGWLESQVWGKGKSRDVSAGGKVTVRLHVSHVRHTLTYAPGGDGVEDLPEGGDFPSGVPMALSSLRPTRTGFAFSHWTSGGTSYLPAESVAFSADTELTAIWTTNKYTVAFDANGGTGRMSALDCEYGKVYELPPVGFSREGHLFDGWLCKDKSRRYDDRVLVFNLSSTDGVRVTMSAVWRAQGCSVTFDPCGGSAVKGITGDYGSAYGELPTSVRAGYIFDGWFTAADGGTKVKPEDKLTAVNGQTLYAHWTAKTSALTFNANGGTGEMTKNLVATYDGEMPGPVNLPTKEGHAFQGFYDTTADGTQYYTATGTSARTWDKDTTSSTTLYARWNSEKYKLTLTKDDHIATLRYSLDGGTTWLETNETCTVDVDFETKLKLYAVPAVGYLTDNDSPSKAVSETMRTTGVAFAPTATPKTSALTFNANGGAEPMSTGLTATYGVAMPTPINLPTREGHTFVGFYDTTSGGTQYYTATGASAKNWNKDTTAATTLYAQWSPNQYQLTLNRNEHVTKLCFSVDGGKNWVETNASCVVDMDFGTKLNLYAVPEVGYQTTYGSSETAYSATMGVDGVLFTPTAAAKTSALTFSANGGSGEMTTGLTATYGAAMPEPINLPTWEGHDFKGFYDTTTGGTQYYTEAGTSARTWNKDTTVATTLYARWDVSGCVLTLTLNEHIESLFYSLDDGNTWVETNASCTVDADFGTKLKLYAVPAAGYLTDNDAEATALSKTMGTTGVTFAPTPTPKTSALTFDTNSGTGTMSTGLTATYDAAMPTPVNLPTWDGHAFTGFFDAASGGTQYYTATGASAKNWNKDTTAATTLYAQWRSDLGEFSEALDTDTLRFFCDDDGWVVTNDSSAVGGTCVATTSAVAVVELKVEAGSVGMLTFNWKLLRPENDGDINDEGYSAKLIPENLSADIPWNVSMMPYKTDWTTVNANVTNGVYKFTFVPGTNSGVNPFSLRLDNVLWTPTEP